MPTSVRLGQRDPWLGELSCSDTLALWFSLSLALAPACGFSMGQHSATSVKCLAARAQGRPKIVIVSPFFISLRFPLRIFLFLRFLSLYFTLSVSHCSVSPSISFHFFSLTLLSLFLCFQLFLLFTSALHSQMYFS